MGVGSCCYIPGMFLNHAPLMTVQPVQMLELPNEINHWALFKHGSLVQVLPAFRALKIASTDAHATSWSDGQHVQLVTLYGGPNIVEELNQPLPAVLVQHPLPPVPPTAAKRQHGQLARGKRRPRPTRDPVSGCFKVDEGPPASDPDQ